MYASEAPGRRRLGATVPLEFQAESCPSTAHGRSICHGSDHPAGTSAHVLRIEIQQFRPASCDPVETPSTPPIEPARPTVNIACDGIRHGWTRGTVAEADGGCRPRQCRDPGERDELHLSVPGPHAGRSSDPRPSGQTTVGRRLPSRSGRLVRPDPLGRLMASSALPMRSVRVGWLCVANIHSHRT